ncbi:hypothetical protein ACFFLM_06285 [Deinococcus oregonensis]|uniref:GIY-YIG domain-containing protein n=1 Tax=Deinococcus oregonensis TaxID=1805970 RepID=A0ABV6AVP4_9DEIO
MRLKSVKLEAFPRVSFKGRTSLPRQAGIYFVMHGKHVLYIGKAKDLYNRWYGNAHHRYSELKDKPVEIRWMLCSKDMILLAEESAIAIFSPPLNQSMGKYALRYSDLFNEYGVYAPPNVKAEKPLNCNIIMWPETANGMMALARRERKSLSRYVKETCAELLDFHVKTSAPLEATP